MNGRFSLGMRLLPLHQAAAAAGRQAPFQISKFESACGRWVWWLALLARCNLGGATDVLLPTWRKAKAAPGSSALCATLFFQEVFILTPLFITGFWGSRREEGKARFESENRSCPSVQPATVRSRLSV
jgi:hypothetical protein